jgi:hypothetical protein
VFGVVRVAQILAAANFNSKKSLADEVQVSEVAQDLEN